MSILLVDDEVDSLNHLKEILVSEGYLDTVNLNSSTALLEYLNFTDQAKHVDLILLDIVLSEIDGIETVKRIKNQPHLNSIPIIFIAAFEDKNKLAEVLNIGGDDYISKPFNQEELLARIRVALRLKKELDWHIEYDKKINQELVLAASIQRSLLSAPVQNNEIKISAAYKPSYNLAGDMYYWQKKSDHSYTIVLFDMMGKGISAALVCMFISSIFRETITNIDDPIIVIEKMNQYMALLNTQKDAIPFYFTGIYLTVDTATHTIEYVNAGHPSFYVKIDNQEAFPVMSNTTAIGFFNDIVVTKNIIHYEEYFQIILFTDGVFEAVDSNDLVIEEKIQLACDRIWPITTNLFDEILTPEQQNHHDDDMCIILIQSAKRP
ncbi:MAG: SpoIIE family protein phosphatase [Kurthia sp.]|nr:SpoIIE family protein phosphatase [Candidatus Kurthia equi]